MNLSNVLRNNSPTILASLGVIGFVASVVMSAKATPAAMEVLDDLPEEAGKSDKFRALVPIYAPTAALVLMSAACVAGSGHLHNYRYGAVLALYSMSERTLSRWKTAALSEVSKKNYEKIRDKVITPDEDIPEEMREDDGQTLFFDVYTGRFFKSDSLETVRRVVNDLNESMYADDFVPLNDFYYGIGLPDVQFGGAVGWTIGNGNISMAYDAFLNNNLPCISVTFDTSPTPPKSY